MDAQGYRYTFAGEELAGMMLSPTLSPYAIAVEAIHIVTDSRMVIDLVGDQAITVLVNEAVMGSPTIWVEHAYATGETFTVAADHRVAPIDGLPNAGVIDAALTLAARREMDAWADERWALIDAAHAEPGPHKIAGIHQLIAGMSLLEIALATRDGRAGYHLDLTRGATATASVSFGERPW